MDKTIYTELSRIQKVLKVPKNQRNNFGNYNYRNCEDILEALKLVLDDCWVSLEDKIELIGERYYVVAEAKLGLGKDYVSNKAYARETKERKGMDESQITGATSSYARKYALSGLLAIDDGRDADSKEPEKQQNKEVKSSEAHPADLDGAIVEKATEMFPQDSFVLSVSEGYKKYKHLTEKQKSALVNKIQKVEEEHEIKSVDPQEEFDDMNF